MVLPLEASQTTNFLTLMLRKVCKDAVVIVSSNVHSSQDVVIPRPRYVTQRRSTMHTSLGPDSLIEHDIRHLILQSIPFGQSFWLEIADHGIVEVPPTTPGPVPRKTSVMTTRKRRANVSHDSIRIVHIRRRHGLVRLKLLRAKVASNGLRLCRRWRGEHVGLKVEVM